MPDLAYTRGQLSKVRDALDFVGRKVTADGVDAFAVARLVYAVHELANLVELVAAHVRAVDESTR